MSQIASKQQTQEDSNRTDPEVEALKKTVDPHESVKALNQSFEEA